MMRVLVLGACLLAGCAEASPPFVAPELPLALPRPQDLGREVEAVQQVTARYGDREFTFQGRVSAKDTGFRLVAVDGFGNRAFTVDWSAAGAVRVERASWLPAEITAENMLADLVLLYWPREVVGAALGGTSVEDAAHSRTVRRGGRPLIEVDYDGAPGDWRGGARLRNLAFGYELVIQSQALSP